MSITPVTEKTLWATEEQLEKARALHEKAVAVVQSNTPPQQAKALPEKVTPVVQGNPLVAVVQKAEVSEKTIIYNLHELKIAVEELDGKKGEEYRLHNTRIIRSLLAQLVSKQENGIEGAHKNGGVGGKQEHHDEGVFKIAHQQKHLDYSFKVEVRYPDNSIELIEAEPDMYVNQLLQKIINKKLDLRDAKFSDVNLHCREKPLQHHTMLREHAISDGHKLVFSYTEEA